MWVKKEANGDLGGLVNAYTLKGKPIGEFSHLPEPSKYIIRGVIDIKILAIEKETPDSNVSGDFKSHLKAEATRVWELYQTEVFRELYFDKRKHNAVIILECKDHIEAEEYLNTLPLVKEGLISFEIIELEPYSGFSRLFGG